VDKFLYKKEILIDDSGWGDLILGVVIGALKLPERRYMDRRIPVSSFQPPNFQNKRYLEEAVKIGEEIVERSFAIWCKEVGIEFERLNGKRSFNTFLEWVAEKPHLRENLVKTGWKSWNQRWREIAYNLRK
jgi:hypothetical protein